MGPALDAHAKPPSSIRALYKKYQQATAESALESPDLVQIIYEQDICTAEPTHGLRTSQDMSAIFEAFLGRSHTSGEERRLSRVKGGPHHDIYQVPAIPGKMFISHVRMLPIRLNEVGLYIYPSLLSPEIELELLDRLLHRDVSHQSHRTNVHLFHHVVYPPTGDTGCPTSFFGPDAASMSFQPIDPAIHKPFSIQQFWDKKLRWVTLGGQYDWTNKRYPPESPPEFPRDIKQLVEDIFPMKAEAAILNLYSPGDTLSLHRDVSEECDKPLVSISIGCEAIFIVGLDGDGAETKETKAAIRLRSGDAILMSGPSRYAWHGVPKVLKETCPEWLQEWPATGSASHYHQWRGWMAGKRINLNVRQMFN